jgi:hypothetical protein
MRDYSRRNPQLISLSRRHNTLVRYYGRDAAITRAAERDLRAVRLEGQIRAAVDAEPPLTGQQIAALQAILTTRTERAS